VDPVTEPDFGEANINQQGLSRANSNQHEKLSLSRANSRDDNTLVAASWALFGEGVVALEGLVRLLAARFLLREKGVPVSDSLARVSVKSLALACISEALLHKPQVLCACAVLQYRTGTSLTTGTVSVLYVR
jgi:hypothetical protein